MKYPFSYEPHLRSDSMSSTMSTAYHTHSAQRAIQLIALCLVSLCATLCYAQTTPRVFIVPALSDGEKSSEQLAKKLTSEMTKYLKRDKKLEIEEGKIKRRGAIEAKLMEFEAQKVSSIDLYQAGKYEEALAGFVSSLRGFQGNLVAIRDMKSLYQILYYAAAVCMELEYGADAKDYLRQLAAISPEGDFEVKVSKRVMKKYKKERKKLLKKKRGAINIETIPLGGKVWVNGVERCVSPCEVGDLPRGQHYVWASKEGVGKAGRLVKVKGGKSAAIKLNLAPERQAKPQAPVSEEMKTLMEGQLSGGRVDGVLQEQLDLVAEEQRVDYIVVTYLVAMKRQIKQFTFLYNVNSKQLVAIDPSNFRVNFSATRIAAIGAARKAAKLIKRFPDESLKGIYQPIKDALKAAKDEREKRAAVAVAPRLTPPVPPVKPQVTSPKTTTSASATPKTTKPLLRPSTPADLTAPPKSTSTSALLPPPPSDPSKAASGDEKSVTSSPWFWTGVGAVVISGAAVSTYLILDSSSSQRDQRFQSRVVW